MVVSMERTMPGWLISSWLSMILMVINRNYTTPQRLTILVMTGEQKELPQR